MRLELVSADDEAGFVLVEALVAVAIIALAGTLVYQIGATMNARVSSDLDRLSAQTQLHTQAIILVARGRSAEGLFPSADQLFTFASHDAEAKDRPEGASDDLHWQELLASPKTGYGGLIAMVVGYDN